MLLGTRKSKMPNFQEVKVIVSDDDSMVSGIVKVDLDRVVAFRYSNRSVDTSVSLVLSVEKGTIGVVASCPSKHSCPGFAEFLGMEG